MCAGMQWMCVVVLVCVLWCAEAHEQENYQQRMGQQPDFQNHHEKKQQHHQQQQNQQQPQQHMQQQGQGHHLKDKANMHDQGHIMEHYDGVMDQGDKRMSDEEMNFHYFKVHDYDKNNMLDGIELISALTHYHKDGVSDPNDIPPRTPDDELASQIDDIMSEADIDKDGYIDYVEYMGMLAEASPQPGEATGHM